MNKKILVTGSEGFIGKNLVSKLKSIGYNVLGVDVNDKLNPINILEINSFRNLVDEFKPNIIVHLAAAVGRVRCEDDIVETINKKCKYERYYCKYMW